MSSTNQNEFWNHIKVLFAGVFQCADRKVAEGEAKMAAADNAFSSGMGNFKNTNFK